MSSVPASKDGMLERQWGVPNLLGGVLYGVDIYDLAADDPLGWGLAVVRDGYLDVEELFVKPSNRRTGIASRLASLLSGRASGLNLPLCFWVPYADVNSTNLATFVRLTRRLNMSIKRSDVPWASYVACDR